MNIAELHLDPQKAVSATGLFKNEKATATAIRLLANQQLKEHTTPIAALLLCVSGQVEYADENSIKVILQAGDFHLIEPSVKHWLNAHETSQLVLVR